MKDKKIDILFVNPFYYELESYSIGVLSISTILEQNHIGTKIVDFNDAFHKGIIGMDVQQCAKYLLSFDSPIIGFSCMSNCYYFYLKIAEAIKTINDRILVVLGGPQATLTAERTMELFPYIDGVFVGESEETIVDDVKYLLGNGKEAFIKNMYYRKNGAVIKAETVPFITNLDNLPLLDYNLLPNYDRIKSIMIESGRGCPFSCTFCSTKTFWKRNPRLKTVNRVIEEIQSIIKNHNITHFSMIHDLFTCKRSYVIDFCQTIINLNMNFTWTCSARIDTVDPELIELMYKAGCRSIFFGVEVGSNEMQKVINKHLKIEKIEPLLITLKQFDFKDLAFSFMYNFPDETEESIHSTVQLLLHILHEYEFDVQIGQCCILPGTELFEQYKNRLTIETMENSMTLSLPIDLTDNIIALAPDIFTQYYIVDTPTFQKYLMLEPFMALYICLFRNFRAVIAVINHHYRKDFFMFYEEFTRENSNWLVNVLGDINFVAEKYIGGEYEQLIRGINMVSYLETWFSNRMGNEDKLFLTEAVSYLRLLLDHHKGKMNDKTIYHFNNDVVGLNNGFTYNECINKPIIVKMIRRDDGSISVLRKFV